MTENHGQCIEGIAAVIEQKVEIFIQQQQIYVVT